MNLNDMNLNELLLQEAIDTWGENSQIHMAYEECGELVAVLAQWQRGRKEIIEVAEEIADVWIMIHQLKRMFGSETVDKIITQKMARLNTRLETYRQKSNSM